MSQVPWYYDYTNLGTPYAVTLSIAGAFVSVSFCAQIYCYIRDETSSAKTAKLTFQALSIATLFIYEYICLCLQFEYLLKNTDAYVPCYESGPDSDILWHRDSSCNNVGTLCNFWNLDVDYLKWDASLMGQDIDKISVGLGLIIYPLLRLLAALLFIYLSDRGPFADSEMNGAMRVAIGIIQAILFGIAEFVIMQQQSCVLMPLQFGILAPDLSSFRLDVPLSQREALCLYKTAAAGIPVGIPLFVGGVCMLSVIMHRLGIDKQEQDKQAASTCALLCFCGSPVIIGLALIVFWLAGGFVIGAW
jgi:hypothetical protein